MRTREERGQAAPLVLVIVAAAAGAMLLVGALGQRAIEGAQAQTAADAAALAGAVEGPAAAEELARLNGSASASVDGGVGDATVTVRVGAADAVARAQDVQPSSGGTDGLQPVLLVALARAEALLGRPVPISSGFRSHAQQAALWERRHSNPFPVARPGTSRHEQGLAVDVPRSFVATLRGVAAAAGLCQPLPAADPVHFEPCRRSRVT